MDGHTVQSRGRHYYCSHRPSSLHSLAHISTDQTTTPAPHPPLPQQTFNFDQSFWTFNKKDATYVDQVGVFDALGPDIMVNVFEGFNACVFAYGQTGSGKTYTMMGEAQATCVLSLSYLRTLDDRTHMSSSYHADIGSLVPYAIRVTPSL
jgi:hypothetical protein